MGYVDSQYLKCSSRRYELVKTEGQITLLVGTDLEGGGEEGDRFPPREKKKGNIWERGREKWRKKEKNGKRKAEKKEEEEKKI